MRIGIYDPYLDSLSGGEKYMLTAASCLSEKHEVFVFWNDPQIFSEAQKKFSIGLSKVKVANNIFSPKVSLFTRLKESKKYDAIFYLSDGSIPIVSTGKLFVHFQFPVEWINGKTLMNRLKMKRVQAIICNSQFTKQFIDKTFGIQSEVVYPPASGEAKDTLTKKQNVILTVGRFDLLREGQTFKKQEVMIEAFKKMIGEGLTHWQLVLVISFRRDDQEKISFLKKQIQGYPIKIVENALHPEMSELYAIAKIYWHAAGFGEDLQKHPEYAEHFGIATVQAMEQGAVPVVMDAGGQKEIVDNKENGFLWNTKEELITKTKFVIKDENLWEKLSEEAQKKAKQFSKEMFCSNLSEIIK